MERMRKPGLTKRSVLRLAGLSVLSVAMGRVLPAAANDHSAGGTEGGRPLLLQETFVAGTAYYQAKQAARSLKEGDTLVLRREPANPHDAMAIAVFSGADAKLGYVPRFVNEPFARLVDDGRDVIARVISVDDGRWRTEVRIGLFLSA